MNFPELLAFIAAAFRKFIRPYKSVTKVVIEDIKAENPPPVVPQEPATDVLPPKPTEPMPPRDIEHTSELYPDWDTPKKVRHNVRAICDQEGLTLEQKNTLCATVGGESQYNIHAKNINYGRRKDGSKYVASTDWGVCQWNDFYHGDEITPHEAEFNPEKAVRLMCKYWKKGEKYRNWWIAYKNGSYKAYL